MSQEGITALIWLHCLEKLIHINNSLIFHKGYLKRNIVGEIAFSTSF